MGPVMPREGVDVVVALKELFRHVEHALGEFVKLAAAMDRQRLHRLALAAADLLRPLRQLADRSGNGAGKDEADDEGDGKDEAEHDQHLAALIVELLQDVARRS